MTLASSYTDLEEQCLEEIARVKPVTFSDIRLRALELFAKRVSLPPRVRDPLKRSTLRYLAKSERVYQLIATEVGAIARLPTDIHPFYLELLDIASEGHYQDIVRSARRMVDIVSRLWKEYRQRILGSSSPEEAKDSAREFVGRALSIVRRGSRYFGYLQEIARTARTTPCIVSSWPTMIVAGMPQVGKSTLVGRISSAKPRVSPYPFTTKTVILGHVKLGEDLYMQVVDTPGILDRPVEDMNAIERKAIAALRHLNAVTVFLMDPSPDSYYSFDSQLRVLESVGTIVGREKVLVVFNKVDKVGEERLKQCAEQVGKVTGYSVRLAISALQGLNVDKLLGEVLRVYDSIYGTSYSTRR